MEKESLYRFYKTEILPSLDVFKWRQRIMFPLVFLQGALAITVFLVIVANVFNGFIGSGGSKALLYGSWAFLISFMTLLGYSILKSNRLLFPWIFNNKGHVIILSLILATFLFAGVRLLDGTPVVFMHFNLNQPVEFNSFFAMFGKFLALFVFTAIVLIPLSLLKEKLHNRFVRVFKPLVIKKLVGFLNPDFNYFPEGKMTLEQILGSKLFYNLPGYYYLSSDLVEGQTGNNKVQFSELLVQSVRHSGNESNTQTVFSGILFETAFNKDFKGITFVSPDYAENILGRLGRGLQKMSLDGTQLVQTENPEFEKYFVVKSTDQVEARYILTPSLIERLLVVRKKINHDIELSFSGSNLYLAISLEKDFISPSYFGEIIPFNKIEDYCSCLDLLFHLVDDLNLNQQIWVRQEN